MSQRDGLRLGYKREWCGAGLQERVVWGLAAGTKVCRETMQG